MGDSHTLIRTTKADKTKSKVVNGEIIELEEGLFTDGRLMLAGFQKIADGEEAPKTPAKKATPAVVVPVGGIDDFTAKQITEELTKMKVEIPKRANKTVLWELLDTAKKAQRKAWDEATPTTPAVVVTAENDGKSDVTIEVQN